jgi:hypothetical protein
VTSPTFNARKSAAAAEMAIYDRLPAAIRQAIDDAPCSVRAKTILDALLRGVSEEAIIQSLKRSPKS